MSRRTIAAFVALAVPVIVLGACGGGPSSPSAQGVVVQGTLVGGGVASSASAGASSAVAATLTISVVENPAISVTVGADGRFTLRGLPEGGFTLVFKLDGVTIGTIPFSEVKPNQEITITVRVDGNAVVVVEERRNGIGHGDLEIEGLLEALTSVNPAADSIFVIAGKTVVARPGLTTIREGNRALAVTDLAVGQQVHVKGTWMTAPGGGPQNVLAHEIKLQEDEDPGTTPPRSACAAGSKAEVEGLINAKAAGSVTVTQQAKGDFLCLVSASTTIRKGNTSYTFDQLQLGWRVHVKGTMAGMSGTACQVTATEIKVQNN